MAAHLHLIGCGIHVSEALRIASPPLCELAFRLNGRQLKGVVRVFVAEPSSTTEVIVHQHESHTEPAQRWLDGCNWWFQRVYAGQQPRTSLVAESYHGSLVRLQWAQIVKLDLHARHGDSSAAPVDCAALTPLLPQLESLDISRHWCRERTLRSVVNASCLRLGTSLRSLAMWFTDIQSLDFLPLESLQSLDVMGCRELADFCRLADGALALRRLCASECAVKDLSPLQGCPRLAELDLSYTSRVHSLDGLAGAASLTQLNASGSMVEDVSALATCGHLCELDVSGCESLATLTPLAGAPELRCIRAASSAVRHVEGLAACATLREVDLEGCPVKAQEAAQLQAVLRARSAAGAAS